MGFQTRGDRKGEMSSPAPARQERPPAALITYSRKRRRLAPSPDWASLDQDLVEQIGWRVLAGDLQDYVRFRAVCSHWTASTVRPQGRGVRDPRFHPRRWMMLPEGHGLYPGHPDLRGYVRFFSLSTGAFVRAHHRLLEDHVILDSVDGLLLLHRDHDTAVRLLHPFTGDIAELPPLDSLLPQMEPTHNYTTDNDMRTFLTGVLRKVCTAVAVSATGTIVVMLAFDSLYRVAYATPGDQRWTFSTWKLLPGMKPMSFQGKLYGMRFSFGSSNKVHIYQIDPLRPATATNKGSNSLSEPLLEKIAEFPRDRIANPVNLVECNSQLLLVAYTDTSCRNLLVYRLADLIDKKIVPMASIGDHTLFLDARSLCVSPSKGLPSISRNSIICIHSLIHCSESDEEDRLEEYHQRLEQYHLDSGIWTPASDGDCVQGLPNPCTLIHHIFTCCRREYWNKGIMFCRETVPKWLVKRNLRIGA